MHALARFVIAHRRLVLLGWLVLAAAGAVAAPHATSRLSYDFGLPGHPGYEANQQIVRRFGGGGDNAPIVVLVGDGRAPVGAGAGRAVTAAVAEAAPGARVASYVDQADLRSPDGRYGAVLVHPRPVPGAEPLARALPSVQRAARDVARRLDVAVAVTGQDALADQAGGGSAGVLAETLFGGVGALVVLLLVFGSALALTPLLIAACSILTTFLVLWGLTAVSDVSFIVQYLLALIGLGVAIDYALLIVTRWREERRDGADAGEAVERAMVTAGRSVLFSGITVAISLAALVVLPVPFLRSVGYTGLLIPVISVFAALTLLPAVLATAGSRLDWPHRRSADPVSRLWQRIGRTVVRHRWLAAVASTLVLLALSLPLFGLRLGQPGNASLAAGRGAASVGAGRLGSSGIGAGLTHPVEILTGDPAGLVRTVGGLHGVAGAAAPPRWRHGRSAVVDVWTQADTSTAAGADAAAHVRTVARAAGAQVGGTPAQDADFIDAVYGPAPWIIALIVVVTFALLARAFRSIVLPLKALLLNVLSIGAAYGLTVLVWQHGVGAEVLFDRTASGALTVWVPIAVFAFLFGLSMDYEVFLLARIREEHDRGATTDEATVRGVARTGRLVSSAALILFLAFVSLSRVPATDVKILATGLAFGIVLDATVVRGVLAPALVAGLGRANWWWPRRRAAR